MGAEGIPNEKPSMLRCKSKILPNPLLGSYELEEEKTRLKVESLTIVAGYSAVAPKTTVKDMSF